ncbi:right-handed parallel beta-helix repeat-containing protein, partial [Candidatus Woesearchaeota archaeon]|nr:right-handed parallel beta-helix repeat-containing protein [Candidatus Woesearchaeota archaeon]
SGVSGHLSNSSTYNVSVKNITGTQVDIVLKNANKYCNNSYTQGQVTWNITSNLTCANETIYVDSNITIFNNGSLTLYNVTIIFQAFENGSNFINKSPNGGLFVYDVDNNASTQYDATLINTTNNLFDFDFWVFGNGLNDNFTMRNSIILGAGYGSKSYGISLHNISNSVIAGNNISGGAKYTLYLNYSTSNNITNNAINITYSSGSGISLSSSSNSNSVQGNIIMASGTGSNGIRQSNSISNNITGNTIRVYTEGDGIQLLLGSNLSLLQNNSINATSGASDGISLSSSSSSNNITDNQIETIGTSSNGIYLLTSSNSNTAQSNTIITRGGSGFGIWLSSSSNIMLLNNTITTTGNTGQGIRIQSSSSSNITSNTITTSGIAGPEWGSNGIYLQSSSNNSATSNIINATGANADGIYIWGNSDNNIFNLNNISKSGRDGIRIGGSTTNLPERNNITNNIILNSTGNGIFLNNTLTASQLIYNNNISYSNNNSIQLNNASNITIISGSLEYSRTGLNASQSVNVTIVNATFVLNTLWDFYIMNNSWITSLNNSFNKTGVNITNSLGDYSNFTVMWYARANVTNSTGSAMNAASVTSTDVNSGTDWTDTTASTGLTGWFATIDYIQNGTVILDYNLHTGTASLTGYLANSSTYNVSVKNITGTQVDIVLKNPNRYCNNSYTQGQVTWNITSNLTCANQTIYVDGNITIFNNGSLTLYNVTINFSAFADGSNFINKSPNGGLFIYDLDSNASTQEDGSWLMSNDSNYEFDFWAFGNGKNDNFTMQNSIVKDAGYSTAGSYGIQLYNVSNVIVSWNNISDGALFGLYLQYSTNNNITNNVINTNVSNGAGIRLDSSSNSKISNNTITTSGSPTAYGIFLTTSSNSNTLQSNTITTNGSSSYGIYLLSSSNSNTIRSNTITINGSDSPGLFASSSSILTISNNTITTRGAYLVSPEPVGIRLLSSSSNNITGNTITTNGDWGYGIYISSSSNSSTLQSNAITTNGNTAYGILLLSSSNNNATGNTITTNGSSGFGIGLTSSSNSTLQSNAITTSGSSGYGISLASSSSSNSLQSNNITTNGSTSYGIWLSSSSNNNATGNIITANSTGSDSIYIFSNSDNNIFNFNNISKSGRDGIRIGGSATNLPERNNITNNIILNSTGSGIFINNTLTASQFIYNNNISYSSNNSIQLNNASNITIISGSLEYSRTGINASQSTNVTIANATFVLNTLWDFYITNNSWLISLNNSFNSTAVNITGSAGDFSNFTVMWYARANVTNSSGIHMNSSSVTSTDVFGASEWTDTTTNGLTGWFAVIDYVQNASSINSSNLHTGTASLTGYLANSSTYNVSVKNITGTQIDIVLKNPNKYCNNSYTQGQATWNITSNLTCANQTIYVDGNITIFNNGSLTLYNVTINFSAFADGSNFINKSPNGGLYIYDLDSNASTQEDGSWLMSNDSNYEFDFWAFGNGANDNFTMQNSKITDAGYLTNSLGVQLYNISNVVVKGNNISGGAYYGLYLQYSTNNNISNNQINTTASSGHGIYLISNSNSNTLSSNTINTLGVAAAGYGIYLVSIQNTTIFGNTVTTGTIATSAYGIYVVSSNNSNISSNTIITTKADSYGIYLDTRSSLNTVQNNTITTTGSDGIGIFLSSSSNSSISSNNIVTTGTVVGVGSNGIHLSASSYNNVTSNTITTNGSNSFGIYLVSISSSNTLQSNTITTRGGVVIDGSYGILITSRSNIVQSNNITTNGSKGYGIYLSSGSSSNTNITGNIIMTNNATGILISSSSNNNATSNIINATGTNADGVYILSDSDNNILNLNNISKPGRDGIRIENSGTSIPERNNITNNIILNSTGNGIFLNNTLTASQFIYNNNISYSSNFSILLSNASNITIISGSLEYSRVGINASRSLNVTIANATFVLNTLWDFYITNNSWLISLNNSFNKSAVNVTNAVSDYSNFTVQWYVDVNVTDPDSLAVSGASVYAYENTTGSWSQEWAETAGGDGFTGKWATIEYVQNGTTIVNYTSNFTAAKSTRANSTIKYITSSQQVDVRLPAITEYCNGNYTAGQVSWNITSNITCANETIYIAGNITIFNNGSLTLYNVTINFSAFAAGSNSINKSPNGGLFIYDLDSNASTQYDATKIISNNSNNRYDFWVFGNGLNDNFTMQNSIVEASGYGAGSLGIHLYNVSNIKITGNNMSGGLKFGIILNASNNNNVSGNFINETAITNIIIYLDASDSNTIQGNTLVSDNVNSRGIYLKRGSDSNIIRSNIIATTGNVDHGIMAQLANSNLLIESNTITTTGNGSIGIFIQATSESNITGNKINTSGRNSDSIYIFGDSNNNKVDSNNISKSGRSGIRLETSLVTVLPERNNITNNIILNSSSDGITINNTLTASQFIYNNNISYSNNSILLNNASNITIVSGSLEYSIIGINASQSVNVTIANATFVLNSLWDFYITNNSWITSLNNSFNKSAVNVTNVPNDYSNFTAQWYVDVNVTYSNSTAVSGATVFAYENSTSSWVQRWTDTTASNGFTGKWAVIEYVQNATNIVNYTSNFTANDSTNANSTAKYITSSQQIDIRIPVPTITQFCNGSYTAGQVSWNITSNVTCANETIYVAGNITIFNNGSLTLYNVTINFSMFADGSGFINKSPNGGLFIYDLDSNASTQEDGSWLMSNDSNYEFDFWAFGNGGNDNFTMQNSKVTDAGYGAKSLGINLYNVSNVIIKGNNISGGARRGFFLESSTNNDLINNAINNDGIGVLLDKSSSNNLSNNIITTSIASANGISLRVSSNSNLMQNNIITPSGAGSHGIQLTASSSSNTISGNKINITSTSSDGISLITDSDNNIINLNNITFARNGIQVGDSTTERNNITNNIILNSTADGIIINNTLTASQFIYNNNITYSGLNYAGIFLNNASNISIIGGILENNTVGINASQSINITVANATFTGSALWDFYITNNSWITSLNNSFNKTGVNVTNSLGDYSNFTNQYYVDVNVTWSNSSAVSGATVFAYENSTSSWVQRWIDTTAATGFTGKWATIEYVQNGTNIINYTSNFTANYTTSANSTIKYITSSQQVDVRINVTAPGAPPAFNITFLITKALAPDMVMAASNETINVTTTVKVNKTTNDISFINITDEIPYDFIYENESRIAVLFINWSDAGSNTIDITANATKTIIDNSGTANTWLIINISNMSTSLGFYMTENDSIQINYLMNSSKMNANDTRLIYTNATVKDIASNTAADFKLTNITSSQIVLRGYKKISADPTNPQNITVGIEMQSLGGKLTSILLVDYLPSSISAKSQLVGLNITYYNKTSNSYKTLTEPEDYKLYNPYNSTLPDGQLASVFSYNFSYNFTNWDGTIYDNDSILINYSIAIVGGGTWVLPAIIGGWDPQYQKHIKTETYSQALVPLFDVISRVLTPKIKPGEDVKALLQMLNVGGPKAKVDVFITYSMKTMKGDLITERSETIAVFEQKEKELVLPTPSTVKPGMYTFETLVAYAGREAASTDVFEVLGEKGSGFNAQWLMFGMFALVLVLIIVFVMIRMRKKEQ